MSHIKNVEAFERLRGICAGYGGSYNPGSPNLQMNALTSLATEARQVMSELHAAEVNFNRVTNAREEQFNDLRRLLPRIVSNLKSINAPALTIEDAKASVRKMVSHRTPTPMPPIDENDAKVKKRVKRGLDFISMTDQVSVLIGIVSTVPNYQPNEGELSIGGLTELLETLRKHNSSANEAIARLNKARQTRSELLYRSNGNLVSTAKSVKHYIRAAFGPRSLRSLEVGKIVFTNPTA